MKRTTAALAALSAAALGTFAVALPASAEPVPDPYYAVGEWLLQDWEGPYPTIERSPAELSTASCDEVVLTKPDVPKEDTPIYGPSADGDIGTSYENGNLALTVEAGDSLTVDYELSHVDNAATTAVRMFAYGVVDANTLNVAPTFGPAIADPVDGLTGTLSIDFAADDIVGTFGLTYDASNDTEGTVTFTNLRLVKADDSEVSLALCPKPEPEPSPTTTTATTAPTLANTGATLTTVVVTGSVLVAAGIVVLVVSRRRREQPQE